MRPLEKDDLHDLRAERTRIGGGFGLAQDEMDELLDIWSPRTQPDRKDASEDFAVAWPDGSTTGVVGPRWIFHLLGLCHRAAHVGFATPNGLVLLQRRAPTKTDWPDAWDMAVAGHVPQRADGSDMTFEMGAFKEIEEELGLPAEVLPRLLVEGRLIPVGSPYFSHDENEERNPPFYNAEARQVFAATLTPEGLAALRPDYEELSGVYLCSPQEAWTLLAREQVASGLRYSLPRYLDWLMQQTARSMYRTKNGIADR
jgi:isopentenyldiphosphate isomerase